MAAVLFVDKVLLHTECQHALKSDKLLKALDKQGETVWQAMAQLMPTTDKKRHGMDQKR